MEQAQPYCPRGELAFDGDPMIENWEDENYWYSQYHDKYGNGRIERTSKKGFLVWLDNVLIKLGLEAKRK